jgi:hypothetical protein
MPTATHPIPAQLAADLADTLTRLRDARADGAPDHNTANCRGCLICIAQRKLDRLCDRLPRKEPV